MHIIDFETVSQKEIALHLNDVFSVAFIYQAAVCYLSVRIYCLC